MGTPTCTFKQLWDNVFVPNSVATVIKTRNKSSPITDRLVCSWENIIYGMAIWPEGGPYIIVSECLQGSGAYS